MIVTAAHARLWFKRTQLVGVRFEKSSNNHCDNQKSYRNQSLAHQYKNPRRILQQTAPCYSAFVSRHVYQMR